MKIVKKSGKLNNKGITLVELLCALAILSLIGTAVVGLVVVSTQSYQRSVMEIEVQQEAQFATNLIGDLVKDAKEVTWDADSIVITKENTGGAVEIYTITHDDAKKTMSLSLNGGPVQLMAEHVDTLPHVTEVAGNQNTYKVDMKVDRVEATNALNVNNINTQRSEENTAAGVTVGEISAMILTSNELILEPNVSKEIVYVVTGVAGPDAQKVTWTVDPSTTTDSNTKVEGNIIKIGTNETSPNVVIYGNTYITKSDHVTPAGSTRIDVHIRRVFALGLDAQLISGSDATAGAVYRLKTNVTGQNFDRNPSVETDYINPYAVEWSHRVNGVAVGDNNEYFSVINRHSGDGPDQNYEEIRLNRSVDSGNTYSFTAVAAHTRGKKSGTDINTNKSGILYTSSVFATFTLEGHIYTLFPGNFYRGSDQRQGELDEWTVKSLVGTQHGIDPNQLQVFKEVRYKVTGTNNWTSWIELNEGGNAIRIHEDSWMFACDKDYDIEIRFGAKHWNGQKFYPTNLGESAYTIRTTLEHARIRFDVKSNRFNQSAIIGVGPESNPIKMSVNTNLYFDVNQNEANRQGETGLRWDRFNKSLILKVQRRDGNKWTDVNVSFGNNNGNPEVYASCDARGFAEMTRTGKYFTFNRKGTYRILVGLGNAMNGDAVKLLVFNESSRNFVTYYDNFYIYNESTGEGIFYIKVE